MVKNAAFTREDRWLSRGRARKSAAGDGGDTGQAERAELQFVNEEQQAYDHQDVQRAGDEQRFGRCRASAAC